MILGVEGGGTVQWYSFPPRGVYVTILLFWEKLQLWLSQFYP